MKIVLISGLSGSGKSVALKLLEDLGYYCVDNLPIKLLPGLVAYHTESSEINRLGISVDIRSRIDIKEAQTQLQALRNLGHEVEILFLEAEEGILVRRFSETRRSHPLSGQTLTLLESLQQEKTWLFPLREAAYCIDTSKMNAQQLRHTVQQWLKHERQGLLVILESFGFKYGVPTNVDFLFDMRSLPNPYYDTALRPFNGMDKPIQDYLGSQAIVQEMVEGIGSFMSRWLPQMQVESRSYVTIGIGCTGGQHRSVYVVEQLARRLKGHYELLVRHRQLNRLAER
ncbi:MULTISPECIES: RNase adapter RapZ [unclassified Neisseria]|uniref:RNase adapter RapZ n=1 Tax=unclassified Neisseria TaxID=2623750 RepID=UPI00107191D1|nr:MULTISPECIES: RNase adapter RapZ [unclassified Neisseria]MBF0804425.1 RNase adapter RapZ [Neisseria sp. 19428wB4_WF04]TFU42795.1 RNase adapter RapZ [Neisseria sp. WF04]